MVMLYSNFQSPRPKAPRARSPSMNTTLNYSGLDTLNPHDLIKVGHSPFAHDFRIYDSNSESRKVQITTRRGSGLYTKSLGETADTSNTSVTGAGVTNVDTLLNWRAFKFVPSTSGRLTKIELNMKRNTGFAPMIVEIYDENWVKIADSSVLEELVTTDLSYTPVYFIEAPVLTSTKTYYVVTYIQDDGSGAYQLATNTASNIAYESNSGVAGLEPVNYAINFKTYITPEKVEKGMYRFNQEGGTNVTIVVYPDDNNDIMYAVNDNDGSFTVVDDTLNKDAIEYSFDIMDGKLFYVNGLDDLKAWDGTTVETITDPELPILKYIRVYKDRLWGVVANESNKIVFSEVPGNPSNYATNEQWEELYDPFTLCWNP
jgi:hypothetical protein